MSTTGLHQVGRGNKSGKVVVCSPVWNIPWINGFIGNRCRCHNSVVHHFVKHSCRKDITAWAQEHFIILLAVNRVCFQMIAFCFFVVFTLHPNSSGIGVVLSGPVAVDDTGILLLISAAPTGLHMLSLLVGKKPKGAHTLLPLTGDPVWIQHGS